MRSTRDRTGPVRSMVGLLRSVHPLPVSITVSATAAMIVLFHGSLPPPGTLIRAVTVVLLSQLAVGSANDYLDRYDDMLYQPEKPIPQGAVSARAVRAFSLSTAATMLPVAATLGWEAFVLAILGTAAGLAYNVYFKRTPAAPLGYLTGFLTLVTYAAVVAGRLEPALLLAYPVGALIVTAAYLAQSFPDIHSDRWLGHRGLAALLGERGSALGMALSSGLVAVSSATWSLVHNQRGALLLILSGSAVMAAACALAWRADPQRSLRRRVFHLAGPGLLLIVVGTVLVLRASL